MNIPAHAAADASPTCVRGVLALELAAGSTIARAALAQTDASRLAALLGRDLAALAPAARMLDACVMAAHFDPAEALRPGWPLHRRLSELHARAPRGDGAPRILAFGADAGGAVPPPLQADPALAGGPLRVLPWLFAGDPARVAEVAEAFESGLLDQGMSAADTALCAQDAFGARIEHVRAMTLHDLAAMTALQYEHAGLAPLWPVIETALLAPGEDCRLDAPPEPPVRYGDGEVRITLLAADAWRARCAQGDDDCERLRRRFAQYEMRQRQFAAVLGAHGIPVLFESAP
jgi:hypothetical protein